jgi:hypothetical protein
MLMRQVGYTAMYYVQLKLKLKLLLDKDTDINVAISRYVRKKITSIWQPLAAK